MKQGWGRTLTWPPWQTKAVKTRPTLPMETGAGDQDDMREQSSHGRYQRRHHKVGSSSVGPTLVGYIIVWPYLHWLPAPWRQEGTAALSAGQSVAASCFRARTHNAPEAGGCGDRMPHTGYEPRPEEH